MSTSSFTSAIARVVLFLTIAAASAAAQDTTSRQPVDRAPSELARRSSASITFIQSRPQGAFGQNVGLGYGLDGAYLLRLDDTGILSLRLSAGVVSYGNESRRTALSESVGGRVLVDVKTNNYIAPMFIGPQITWPSGSFRPYVNAGVGGQALFTESHLEGTADRPPFASTTNHSSFAASWALGGGVYMPIYAGKTKVQLDLGMQYLNGGRTRYLAPGSITDLPGAQISVTPLESATHLVIVRLGARIGL
jgi:opacity protein-like surface antigen